MRITDLEVDGFGVWRGLRLSELSDQVNVFYGANEAGKTTLMQFVRSILYGFSPDRRARYLPPLRGGRPGGSLHAVAGEESFTLTRHCDAGDELGQAIVADRHGMPVDDARLEKLLGEVDEPLFNNVFAFGLREIQELNTLSDSEAAHLLYDLTLGLDRVSLVEVLGELESSRNRLLAADDRPSLVVQAIGERERLRAEIHELSEATPRYLELVRQRRLLVEEIARLEVEGSRLEEKLRIIELAGTLSERWRSRAAIDRQLSAIGPSEGMPEEAFARLEKLNQRLRTQRRRRRGIKRAQDELRAESAKLAVNESLAGNAARIEALGEQQEWIARLDKQIRGLQDEIAELELARDADRQEWAAVDAKFDSSRALPTQAIAGLRGTAKTLVETRRRARHAHGQFGQARESTTAASQRIRSALANNRGDQNLTKALERAGQLVTRLRRRIQLDERLDQMSRREAELEEQSHQALDRQLLPPAVVIGLGAVFVIGCALILLYVAGLTLPASITGALSWPLALLGLGGTASAGAIKVFLERSAQRQLEDCRKQSELLAEQMKEARSEREALDKELPRGGGPLVARLQAAEKELAKLEELLPLEAEREAAQREAKAAHGRRHEAKGELEKVRRRWRQQLAQAGLPESLKPSQLRSFKERHERLRELGSKLEERSGELAQRRRELDAVQARINGWMSDAGLKAAAGDAIAQLRQLLAELREQQSRVIQRDRLKRRLAKLRRKELVCAHALDRLRQRRKILFLEVGAADEADFRRRAATQAEIAQHRLRRATLSQEIASLLAGHVSEETIAPLLSESHDLAKDGVESRTALASARAELARLYEQRGQWNEQLKTLTEDRRLPQKQLQLGTVEKRLGDALDRWRVLAVCTKLLESIRELYERERQPEALREASKYLRRLTGGRYERVWTPLGQHVLRVDDGEGHALPVEVLSRGTREQLFLSLRLALVSSFATRGIRLPLVLDDVLVNFDATRAKAAAAVLRDFAKDGFQLLVFTCHEHISKLFKAAKAEVRQLPDNGGLAQSEPLEPEPAKKSRRPRVEPEAEEADAEIAAEAVSEPAAPPVVEPTAIEPEPTPIVVEEPKLPEPIAPKPERALPRPHLIFPLQVPSLPAPVGQNAETVLHAVKRVGWDAEEFEGELADRVKRGVRP